MIYVDNKAYDWNDLSTLIEDLAISGTSSKWHIDLNNFLMSWVDNGDFVCFNTSGSTGTPKEIKHKKSAMIKSAENTLDFFGFKSGQNALMCLPPKFVAGAMMIVRSIVGDLNLHCQEPTGKPTLSNLPIIDFAAMTPYQVYSCLSSNLYYFDSVGHLIIGGAPTSNLLHSLIKKIDTNCYQTFGMTETITHVALRPLNGVNESQEYKALRGVDFFQTVQGTLGIDVEYLDSSPLETNDLVELVDNKRFKWLGRMDNVINSGGVKIMPEQVEAKLTTTINSRFIIGSKPDQKLGRHVILLIEGLPLSDDELSTLKGKMKGILNPYEMPKQVYFCANFLRTETGKIKREVELYDLK